MNLIVMLLGTGAHARPTFLASMKPGVGTRLDPL
jgi:hypothetical protein